MRAVSILLLIGAAAWCQVAREANQDYETPEQEIPRAMAHITGGGLPGNLPRVLPEDTVAVLQPYWSVPPVFGWLASLGVEAEEMWRVFNMGLGFACVVASESTDVALKALARGGTPGFVAGTVVEGEGVTLR